MPTDHIDTDVFGDNNRRVVSSDDSAAEEAAAAANTNAHTRDVKPDGQIHKEADGMFAAAIRCPTAVVGLVAGRDQHNFKEICSKHVGAKIEIARRRPEDAKAYASKPFMEWVENTRCCVINVWSSKKDITEAALEDVEARVQNAAKRAPFTHFICLPFLAEENQPLISAIEAFKTKTLSTSNLLNDGIDESVMVTSKQIHFTLLMLRIYDEATMNTVLSTLDEFVNVLKSNKTAAPSFPLKVHFKGVHVFDTDKPTRANVVFTHAGQASQAPVDSSPVVVTSPAANMATESAQSDNDELPPGHVMSRIVQNVEQLQSRLQRLCEVKSLEDEHKKVLTACISSMPPVVTTLKTLAEKASSGRARTPGGRASLSTPARSRDVSTVTGPVVSDIFNMFEVLVNKMSKAGVLTEEDKRERRIQADADGKLAPQSLTLHLTLMSSKWRSPSSARKLADKGGKRTKPTRSRGNNPRPKPVFMDVAKVLDANYDFGEAVITTLQLCRRAMSAGGDFSRPEKIYKLAD